MLVLRISEPMLFRVGLIRSPNVRLGSTLRVLSTWLLRQKFLRFLPYLPRVQLTLCVRNDVKSCAAE
jgi:hypothetical protein